MGYESAPATKMLATHCCVCGKALVDSISVSLGIGPDCRGGDTGGISPEVRAKANSLTYRAAIAAQEGNISLVREIAQEVIALGLGSLGEKIASRFTEAEKQIKIVIEVNGGSLHVKTPFRRGDSAAFIAAWRQIPGRKFAEGANIVPVSEKRRVWELLQQFFPAKYGRGPKGLFRVPASSPAINDN